MDEREKLFKKLPKKERKVLRRLIFLLQHRQLQNLQIKKLKDTSCYRLRKGRLRIIFSYKDEKLLVHKIRTRNEKTYKNL